PAARGVRSRPAPGKLATAAPARAALLRVRLLERSVTRSSLRSGLEAAAVLEGVGWRRDALRVRLVVARVAFEIGAREMARHQLELARSLGARGTTVDRIELCHAEAQLEIAAARAGSAQGLLARGMHLLEGYQAALGAIELRAASSAIGAELPRLGLQLALESRRPPRVLAWAERLRANALRLPPVRPP